MGWKVQRARLIRDGADTAAELLAAERGKLIRHAAVTVLLPVEYSHREDRDGNPTDGEDAATPVAVTRTDENGDPVTVLETWRERVHVEWSGTADPTSRWSAAELLRTANRIAREERRKLRPMPSADAAEDAASDVIARLLARDGTTLGALPYRREDGDGHGVNVTYLRTAIHGLLANAERLHEDADAADADTDDDGRTPAQRAADAAAAEDRPDHFAGTIDEADLAAALADADAREVAAALAAAEMIGSADAAELIGCKPGSVRVYLQRGRERIARDYTAEQIRDRLRAAANASPAYLPARLRTVADTARRDCLRLMAANVPGPARPIREYPPRLPARDPANVREDRREVGHAPVREVAAATGDTD